MKNKKLLIGLGILAAGAAVYYFFFRSASSSGGNSAKSLGSVDANLESSTSESPASIDVTLNGTAAAGAFQSAGTRKKQVRVNCRVEAKNRGLRGRDKRNFRKECKRNGGFDDGLDNE